MPCLPGIEKTAVNTLLRGGAILIIRVTLPSIRIGTESRSVSYWYRRETLPGWDDYDYIPVHPIGIRADAPLVAPVDFLFKTVVTFVGTYLSLIVSSADSLKDQIHFLGAIQVVAGQKSVIRRPFLNGELQLAVSSALLRAKVLCVAHSAPLLWHSPSTKVRPARRQTKERILSENESGIKNGYLGVVLCIVVMCL